MSLVRTGLRDLKNNFAAVTLSLILALAAIAIASHQAFSAPAQTTQTLHKSVKVNGLDIF
jgi:hypothetical protein